MNKEPDMENSAQLATWWQAEKTRAFTRLECGRLGAVFSAVAIFFLFTIRTLIG
jgi:hypothetical protein